MKNLNLPSAAVGAIIMACVFSITSFSPRVSSLEKWEYDVEYLMAAEDFLDDDRQEAPDDFLRAINKKGQDGWEFAGVVVPLGIVGTVVLYKRPIK
jgi:hypothetical protein